MKDPIEELRHRVEALEQIVSGLLRYLPEIKLNVEVPRVILEKRPVYIRIEPEELHGRILLLALDGFLDKYRSASEIASELLRRGWPPKDFQHVRPALEHLVCIGLLERIRDKQRKAKWLYRAAIGLTDKVKIE